jgi:hypothetical protein
VEAQVLDAGTSPVLVASADQVPYCQLSLLAGTKVISMGNNNAARPLAYPLGLNTPGLSMFNGSCTAVASGIIQTTTPAVFNTGPPLHLACFNSTYPTWWNIDLTYVLEKSKNSVVYFKVVDISIHPVYFIFLNFIVVNDEFLCLMNSTVSHNYSIYKC